MLLPFPHGKVKAELAATIAEMEKEYIKRHNTLLNNREIFASLIQKYSDSKRAFRANCTTRGWRASESTNYAPCWCPSTCTVPAAVIVSDASQCDDSWRAVL